MKKGLMTDSLLPLNGAFNFRDMGGLKTSDGRIVRKGLLFRAAELTGLTREDIQFLQRFNIKYIFDYRREEEALSRPDPNIGNAKKERIPAIVEDNIATNMLQQTQFVKDREYFLKFTVEHFLKIYAELPIQNPSYKRLMDLLKEPDKNLPLIHHCTAGRDRTGIGSMIILRTLGVPYETVLEDYLLSNKTLEDYHNEIFEKVKQFFNKEEYIRFRESFPLRREYLDQANNAIIETYGDFETYLEEEFSITKNLRKEIQEFCLTRPK